MFEHSSKPPIFFLHNLKYIGTESHCLAQLTSVSQMLPSTSLAFCCNQNVSPFSIILIFIQPLVCNDLNSFHSPCFLYHGLCLHSLFLHTTLHFVCTLKLYQVSHFNTHFYQVICITMYDCYYSLSFLSSTNITCYLYKLIAWSTSTKIVYYK